MKSIPHPLATVGEHPVEVELELRHPYCALSGLEVRVNGKSLGPGTSRPGSWVALKRSWNGRQFDILADGQKLASERLTASHHDRFFERVYPLIRPRSRSKCKPATPPWVAESLVCGF